MLCFGLQFQLAIVGFCWFNVGGGYWRLVVCAFLYVGFVYGSVLMATMRWIDIG